jgi:hypothetical protein
MTDIRIGGRDYIAVSPGEAAYFSPAMMSAVTAMDAPGVKDYF